MLTSLETEMARWQTGLHHPVSVYAKQVVRGRLHDQCCPMRSKPASGTWTISSGKGPRPSPTCSTPPGRTGSSGGSGSASRCGGWSGREAIQLQPWQVFDLGCTYGWVRRDTGARRFKRTYNKRARGNFKSTEKSGQALYHMCGDAMYPPTTRNWQYLKWSRRWSAQPWTGARPCGCSAMQRRSPRPAPTLPSG